MTDFMEMKRADEERSVVAIACTFLTDVQVGILCRVIASAGAERAEALCRSILPAEHRRAGPLLVQAVPGAYVDFPLAVKGPIDLYIGSMCCPESERANVVKVMAAAATNAASNPRGLSIASAAYHKLTGWPSPTALADDSSRYTASAVYAAQGLSPRAIGSGYDGVSPVKGSMPAFIAGGGMSSSMAPSVQTDPSLAAASQQATEMVR